MKTLKSILVIVLITILNLSFVNAAEVLKDKKSLSAQIEDYINYPKSGLENGLQGKVFIVYRILEDNSIVIDNIFSANEELKAYVIETLEGKTVDTDAVNYNTQFTLSIVFEFIE